MARRGKPIGWEVREKIWRRIEQGHTRRAIAGQLRLARATVDKYAHEFLRRQRAHLSAEN